MQIDKLSFLRDDQKLAIREPDTDKKNAYLQPGRGKNATTTLVISKNHRSLYSDLDMCYKKQVLRFGYIQQEETTNVQHPSSDRNLNGMNHRKERERAEQTCTRTTSDATGRAYSFPGREGGKGESFLEFPSG